MLYVKQSTSTEPLGLKIEYGYVIVPCKANTLTKTTVKFKNKYIKVPAVVFSVLSQDAHRIKGKSVNNLSATQCDICVYRDNTIDTGVYYIVIGE